MNQVLRSTRNATKYLRKPNPIRSLTYETKFIPNRETMLSRLDSQTEDYDLIIIGGGSTGSGCALDAAQRGLKVLMIEKEDYSSGTSSRSTKLIWGGSRYLVTSLVSLFHYDLRLLREPKKTIQNFLADFKMVMNCHRERKFLLETQPHLTNWIPIAVPLKTWFIWPPPFKHPIASLGTLGIFPLFFKFYDALSGFSCPPSHIMTPRRAKRKFPQLANSDIKYCSIFYEGQHDDSRTNLAIALSAMKAGATCLNYTSAQELLKDPLGKVTGVVVKDEQTGKEYSLQSKSVLFCGGPFTDDLRQLEEKGSEKVVKGSTGVHIVLPSYFAPSGIGLVDMTTSDGRFLFYLPWEGHVLIGTTDHPCEHPTMRPKPLEAEIKWLLTEASKYLSPELHIRRKDVLSAWSGIRPLAINPYANQDQDTSSDSSSVSSSTTTTTTTSSSGTIPLKKDSSNNEGKVKGKENTAAMSRDHIVARNPKTGVIFVAGGKWTTYREMAEDAIDKVIEAVGFKNKPGIRPCSTLTTPLVGRDGYSSTLHIRLIQEYGIASSIAQRLSRAYGGRAFDVMEIARKELGEPEASRGVRLVPGYPYLEAEVIFAARYEHAIHAEDILARRTRLAFLNKEATLKALPRVVELMSQELKWTEERKKEEIIRTEEFMKHFGGPTPIIEDFERGSVIKAGEWA